MSFEFEQHLEKKFKVENFFERFFSRVEARLPQREAVNPFDAAYQRLVIDVLENGVQTPDRTGTGTVKIFGTQLRLDLRKGFPLLTTKRTFFRGVKEELLWFLAGETNVKKLQKQNITIWDEWANAEGELGPVYGSQWRKWHTADGREIDQLKSAIEGIKKDPFGRRHIVTAWNPGEIDKMALPPCHMFFQFNVMPSRDGGSNYLDCLWYQRSVDTFLGLPFNVASYALLTNMVAQITGLRPGTLTASLGDTHIYLDHFSQTLTQLVRDPFPAPTLNLNPDVDDIDAFTRDDIKITKYQSHETIKANISV